MFVVVVVAAFGIVMATVAVLPQANALIILHRVCKPSGAGTGEKPDLPPPCARNPRDSDKLPKLDRVVLTSQTLKY